MTRQLDIDLARHPFLFGMSRQDVGLLADCAVRVHFAEGEIVFREGEEADRVHLIESGNVSLRPASAMSAVVFETVGPGELLGSSWLLPPHKWRMTAQASGPVTAIVLNGALLRKYSERDHSLGFQLFKRISEVMTRRLESARQRLLQSDPKEAAPHRTTPYAAAGDDQVRCE